MIEQRDSWLWYKANGLSRYLLVHLAAGVVPLYTVNEFPKSGGTWLAQMLARALNVPFPRNRLPMLRPAIMHGHYLRPWGMKNVVVVWRDGRDVMVSLYFHSLFDAGSIRERLVREVRRELSWPDYSDVRGNLPRFIQHAFESSRHPRFSWAEFVERWHGRRDVTYVRYCDLQEDAAGHLRRIVHQLTGRELPLAEASRIAEEFSFERQSGRRPGQESPNSFLRKGVVGDWKNYFTDEAKQVFDHYAGDALIQLGYEPDRAWVGGGEPCRSPDPLRTSAPSIQRAV